MEQGINKLPFLGNANAGSEVDVTGRLPNHPLGPMIGQLQTFAEEQTPGRPDHGLFNDTFHFGLHVRR